MIAVKLMGGLGNQMFQYAFGKKLSLMTGKPLMLDKSFLDRRDLGNNFTYRNFDLDIFKLNFNFLNSSRPLVHVLEPHFHYSSDTVAKASSLLNQGHSLLIEGYWQSEKYFQDIREQIIKDFTFVNDIKERKLFDNVLQAIGESNSVLINVRRTDYLNTDFHGVMGLDYISQARKIVTSKINDAKFFVFSDDIEWCRSNLSDSNTTIVDHSFAGEKFSSYLQLMSKCKHFIIPNSSFAWWSVYLSESKNKLVVSPKNWFSPTKKIDTSDIYLEDWIRV
jgi:hypothetical protein